MTEDIYQWTSRVRDYELDSLALVHHSTFLRYLEQCRNDYSRTIGIDLHFFREQELNLVVTNVNIDYHRPLLAQEDFIVAVTDVKLSENSRIIIEQNITKQDGKKLVAEATITVACVDVNTKRACMPDILREKFVGKPR